MNRKKFTKSALILSVILMIAWSILGTSATIAWFTDTTPVAKNSFVIGELDLDVFYKNDVVTEYTEMTSESRVFNDEALYEPNYTQVVYLRIENNGDVDFKYKLSVDVRGFTNSTNVYGMTIHLPEHLKFGVVFGATEADLNRELAQTLANLDMEADLCELNQYSEVDKAEVKAGEERYAALIIYMPKEVGNEANYRRGETPPQVELGVTVFAQQADAPLTTD